MPLFFVLAVGAMPYDRAMTILALILSALLLALAGLHTLWAIGYWFPIRDEGALVKAVIGGRSVTRMPGPIPCALVAVGLLWAAVSPWWGDGMMRHLSIGLFALVFGLRGGLAYTPFWRRITPQEPFATLDRTRYGPMCLVIGLGFVALWIGGPM